MLNFLRNLFAPQSSRRFGRSNQGLTRRRGGGLMGMALSMLVPFLIRRFMARRNQRPYATAS